jgi:hypothetical protein
MNVDSKKMTKLFLLNYKKILLCITCLIRAITIYC